MARAPDKGGDGQPPRKGAGKAQILNPPNVIASKVSGGGALSPEMIARAEKAVERHAVTYPARAQSQIDELSALVDEATASDAGSRQDFIGRIFRSSHNIRGQGATFGYDLVTEIGSSLCRFTDGLERCDDQAMVVIRTHVDALRSVIVNKVKGDGGGIGREIAAGLAAAVEKYGGR